MKEILKNFGAGIAAVLFIAFVFIVACAVIHTTAFSLSKLLWFFSVAPWVFWSIVAVFAVLIVYLIGYGWRQTTGECWLTDDKEQE
jgi:hypothetical protein